MGCVMAAGSDWVEVSIPEHMELAADLKLRFPPSKVDYVVRAEWRSCDRVGFTYVHGSPPQEPFAGIPGLLSPCPASLRRPNGASRKTSAEA